ncbi:recombination-associated protein RdgC [Candidatus Fukatsuia symbiotica]|uniref:Recombination-associated protein RdgC n=1 Tax=Candidatus Fukatsuia symbiotica TaxID=1878942 RepID=A0A2U8I2V2_9GAMM|nr:recombination-associated protein RdgC [Candidatus Fukatsuia symbiotica]AWK13428.1 recombination-associated protein RdgC [Candidatus Fukatsuia symbiotica]MEA9444320.1 recombination-associated protein RdgC [Candidatus Fukatsuia symbiotica]
MPWFKNLMIYRLKQQTSLPAEQMEKQLSNFSFIPCSSQDITKMGWISPMGTRSNALVHHARGQIFICAAREEKIIPSTVVKRELKTKIDHFETEKQRKIKKTEKESLKDEVLHGLLPRAFSRFDQTLLWIDTINNLIMVNTASAKRAEDILALLRKSLGSLPVVPLTLKNPVELTLTEWVRSENLPANFTLMYEAELKASGEDGGLIRCKQQDLASNEIAAHIEAGKRVTKLALNWREKIQFVLGNDGSLKRLKFVDTLHKQNDDIDNKDFAQRFAADCILMTDELAVLIQNMIEALGGLAIAPDNDWK